MWGALIFLYFKLTHSKGRLVEGFGLFCLCISSLFSLFMPLEFNSIRNEKLLKKRLVLFDALDRKKARTCGYKSGCKSVCNISFYAFGKQVEDNVELKYCNENYRLEYAKGRPDIFVFVSKLQPYD